MKDEFQWAVQRLKGKALIAVILLCNNRIDGHAPDYSWIIFHSIVDAVRLRLYGLKDVAYDSVNRERNGWGAKHLNVLIALFCCFCCMY